MEGVLGAQDIKSSWWGFFEARKFDKFMDHDPSYPVQNWTIVDIDNYLGGNPHVQIAEKDQ